MSLLKYFKLKSNSVMPNPNGHLSKIRLSSSIIAANNAVKHAISQTTKARGPDLDAQFTAEEKARMGKRAAESGIASTVRYFNKIILITKSKKVVYVHGRTNIRTRLAKESMMVKMK